MMNMKGLFRHIFAAVILVTSCAVDGAFDARTEMEAVEVQLKMNLAGNDLETRQIVDPEVTEDTSVGDLIGNFWIIQYDGTDDDARLVGKPRYYSDMSLFLSPESEGGYAGSVSLVPSVAKNRIVILANTFDPLMTFPESSDFGDLKKRMRSVTDDLSFLSLSGDDRYLVFCGSTEVVVSENAAVSCLLSRNVAKVTINIKNTSEDVTIDSWQIRSVPSISFYFTDYDLPSAFPAYNDFNQVDFPTFVPDVPLGPDGSEEYVVYLPVNKRGVDERATTQSLKNYYAPTNATVFQINASYDDGVPIQYTFYLGENLINDYNILPNRSYTFDLNIKGKGDADTDYRVKELGLVDFTTSELANCYVINPAQAAGVRRKFMIPVKRVDEFWGNNGYENNPNYTLGSSKEWHVEMIACNFDNSDGKLTFTKDTGTGGDDYFEFTVEPGTSGNAVVALYAGDTQVCWSWHLWITDYIPEEAYSKIPQDGVYSYSVTGGTVHRYEGDIWEGEYSGRFIMDRYLGTKSVKYPEKGNGNGSVYYQFGRKDPLFGSQSDGFKAFNSYSYSEIVDANSDPLSTLTFSVHNPLTFISTSARIAWTGGNKYNPAAFDSSILWQDPYTSPSFAAGPIEKSIFDPCPVGYCVPKNEIWADFRIQTAENPTTNVAAAAGAMNRGFPEFNSTNAGMYYWPYPDAGGKEVPDEVVYYPAMGVIQNTSLINYYGLGNMVYVMSANAHEYDTPWVYHATSTSLGSNTGLGRGHAGVVRCITVRDVE